MSMRYIGLPISVFHSAIDYRNQNYILFSEELWFIENFQNKKLLSHHLTLSPIKSEANFAHPFLFFNPQKRKKKKKKRRIDLFQRLS